MIAGLPTLKAQSAIPADSNGRTPRVNLIFFSRREGKARHLNLSHPLTMTLIGMAGLAVLAGVFAAGVKLGIEGRQHRRL